MTVSVQKLQEHIDKLNNGYINFSEIDLNLRADLVLFNNVSIEKVASMSEDDVNSFLDRAENTEEPFENGYGFTCGECKQPVRMTYTDNPSDGYTLECRNGHYGFVSVYVIEGIEESMDYADEKDKNHH